MLGFTATPAFAKEALSAKIFFNDLDLRTDAKVSALDRRLGRAIKRVCGGLAPNDTFLGAMNRRCRAATLADVTPSRDAAIRLARNWGRGQVAALNVTAPSRRN